MLLACEAIYGRERGAKMGALLEQATGEPCPCRQGRTCPLMPADDEGPTMLPVPRVRGDLGQLRPVVATVLAGYGIAATKVMSAMF